MTVGTSAVSSTSYVLLEVVRVPFTPWVAMTARRLSPSTRSLYFSFPLCSSMWMTARDTSGMPCTTTWTQRYRGLETPQCVRPHPPSSQKPQWLRGLGVSQPGFVVVITPSLRGDCQERAKAGSACVMPEPLVGG